MRISIFLMLFLLFVLQGTVRAQTPEMETLKLNSSPAYIMLGIEPENIQRPSSPTQFIGGVQNALVNGKLKPNLAMEVTPYFWKNPRTNPQRFEETQYLVPKTALFRTIAQTFTVSLGTSESDTVVFGKLRPGTGIGTGIRFNIIEGRPVGKNVERLRKWIRLMHKQALLSGILNSLQTKETGVSDQKVVDDAIAGYIAGIGKERSIYNLAKLYDTDEFIEEIKTALDRSNQLNDTNGIRALTTEVAAVAQEEAQVLAAINASKLPFAKTGFILELAAGSAFIFQGNKFADGKHAKTSFWLTPSYRWDVSQEDQGVSLLDVAGVLRLTINNRRDSVDIANYFDAGLKFQYTHNRWSASAEGVYRHASNLPEGVQKKFTYRFATSVDYKLSDQVTFKFSFGSNFDGNTATYSDPKEMFAVGGLNLGLFNPRK